MLLLLTFAAVGVIGFVISKKTSSWDTETVASAVSITSYILLVVCFVALGIKTIGESGKKVEMQAKHDAIMQIMGNKDDIVTLTKDIAEYNGEILSGRERKKSLWIGLFVYDCYNDLPTIEVRHVEED